MHCCSDVGQAALDVLVLIVVKEREEAKLASMIESTHVLNKLKGMASPDALVSRLRAIESSGQWTL